MPRQRALVLGLMIAGLYYLIIFDGGELERANIESLNQQKKTKQAELQRLEGQMRNVREYEAAKVQVGQEIEKIVSFIPRDFRISEFMKILSTEAKAAGTSIVNIADSSGRAGIDHGFFKEISVRVELEGSFSQVMVFLSYLTKIDRVITMSELSVEQKLSRSPNGTLCIPLR